MAPTVGVLLSSDRWSAAATADAVGVSRPTVWRWQQRFAEDGVAGLLKDRTRPPGKPPFPKEIELEAVALTCSEPPGEVTHWTGRAMAKAAGISHGTVQPDFDTLCGHGADSLRQNNALRTSSRSPTHYTTARDLG